MSIEKKSPWSKKEDQPESVVSTESINKNFWISNLVNVAQIAIEDLCIVGDTPFKVMEKENHGHMFVVLGQEGLDKELKTIAAKLRTAVERANAILEKQGCPSMVVLQEEKEYLIIKIA